MWAGEILDIDKDKFETKNKYFFGCNTFVDYEIGRFLDEIDRVVPDAFVIYTSDHGALMFSHSLFFKGPCEYEENTHIPFIIRGKGVPQNTVDNAPVSHSNIAPTIFELFGLKQPEVFVGKSLIPQIEGTCDRVNDYVFTEFHRYSLDHDMFGGLQLMRAAFDGRYKLSINLLSTDELYDIQADPAEMHNLINSEQHKAVRNRLHDAILDEMDRTSDPFRGYCWAQRPWREDPRPYAWDQGMIRQRLDEDYLPRPLSYYSGMPIQELVKPVKVKTEKKFG